MDGDSEGSGSSGSSGDSGSGRGGNSGSSRVHLEDTTADVLWPMILGGVAGLRLHLPAHHAHLLTAAQEAPAWTALRMQRTVSSGVVRLHGFGPVTAGVRTSRMVFDDDGLFYEVVSRSARGGRQGRRGRGDGGEPNPPTTPAHENVHENEHENVHENGHENDPESDHQYDSDVDDMLTSKQCILK